MCLPSSEIDETFDMLSDLEAIAIVPVPLQQAVLEPDVKRGRKQWSAVGKRSAEDSS